MYRSCEDCVYGQEGICALGHDSIYKRKYDRNQCEDGTGAIYFS